MGNWNLPYTNHDINVAIESYHANLKAILKATKSLYLENRWIGASTNYWEMFCCIIGIRV